MTTHVSCTLEVAHNVEQPGMYYMGEGKALILAGEMKWVKLVHAREHVQVDKENKWKNKDGKTGIFHILLTTKNNDFEKIEWKIQ